MSYEAEMSASERLKRSQERLRDLYHDEVNPRFHVPRIPGLNLIILVSLSILIFISANMLFKFNYFITLQEDVFAKRGHLEGAYQRRINLFDNLLKLTLNHAALEHEVFSHVADVRKDIIKKLKLPPELESKLYQDFQKNDTGLGMDNLQGILQQLDSGTLETSMGRLLGIVEQYPNVKSSETYAQMMDALLEIENRIVDRRMVSQEAIRAFNKEINSFPWSLLAQVTGFTDFEYFEAENAAHYRPRMHAETFEELLPLTSNFRQEKKSPAARAAELLTPDAAITSRADIPQKPFEDFNRDSELGPLGVDSVPQAPATGATAIGVPDAEHRKTEP
ncbi:MAG: LemA family protein [Gammaproteobacteria bacterium]|nr:LemA family protein [Gammaproteobacteria bacterium]